jgi:hypothetical protein
MAKAPSPSNATALRDETPGVAVAAPDGDRADPARPLLRRLDSVAGEVRPDDGGRLAASCFLTLEIMRR